MKKLVGLAVVLAVLVLGSYYGTGFVTERTLKKNIVLIEQSNGWTLKVVEYKRGLFRSYALLDGTFHVPARTVNDATGQASTEPAVDVALKIPLDIYHGPVIFADAKWRFGLGYARSDLTIPETYADKFKQTFTADSSEPHLNLSLFINYFNNTSLLSNVPAFKLISNQGKKEFEWLGMTSDLHVSSNANHLEGKVLVDGVNLKDTTTTDAMYVRLGKIEANYDLNRTTLALYVGDGNILFPSLVVMKGEQKAFEIQNLDLHSGSRLQDHLLSTSFKVTLGALYSDGKSYGPAVLDISFSNLDADTLVKINANASRLQQGTEAQRHQALLSLLPELPNLLSKGAQLAVNEFSITTPEGVIKGNLLLSLPNAATANPFQLIQSMQGDGKITLSAAVVKKLMLDSAKQRLQSQSALNTVAVGTTTGEAAIPAPAPAGALTATATAVAPDLDQQAMTQSEERILNLVTVGLLAPEGDDYVIAFKLSGGQLSVNGKPFNPAMMQF